MKWVTLTTVKKKLIDKCRPCVSKIFPTSTALRIYQIVDHQNIPDHERLYINIPVRTLQPELELDLNSFVMLSRREKIDRLCRFNTSSRAKLKYSGKTPCNPQTYSCRCQSARFENGQLKANFLEFECNQDIEADKKEKQITETDTALNRYKEKFYDLQGQLQSAETIWDAETQRLTQAYSTENHRLLNLGRQSIKDRSQIKTGMLWSLKMNSSPQIIAN